MYFIKMYPNELQTNLLLFLKLLHNKHQSDTIKLYIGTERNKIRN